MRITLLFFASLREQLGTAGEDIELPDGVSDVAQLRKHLAGRGGAWEAALADGRRVRAAVNQDMAHGTVPLKPGDEVAFFPPVTGG